MNVEEEIELIREGNPRGDGRRFQEEETRLGRLLRALKIPCSRSANCRHRCGCVESILKDSLRLGLSSYLVKLGMSLIFKIRSILHSPSLLLQLIVNKNAVRFGLFVGSFVLIFRTILCSLRRCMPEERQSLIPLLAGALGGLVASLFLERPIRKGLALFLVARALDITYQNLVRKGYLPEWRYFYIIVYALCMAVAGYAYTNEPASLPPELNKFYLAFSNETLGDMQMRQIWIERKNNQLAIRGIARQDPLAFMPKLKKYYLSLKGSR